LADIDQIIDFSQEPPEKRVRLDPLRLAPGGSGLARYLELWRDARNGDVMALLSRIQARGLDRRVTVLDYDGSGYVFRFLGAGISFADAATRQGLIGKPPEAFGDLATVKSSREGYRIAIESDAPLCEMVDRQRLNAAGQALPRQAWRRLVLPVPINGKVTRMIIASEFIQRLGKHERS
jgi:hypothetical protein